MCDETVSKRQTILLSSLKFRIIVVHNKISKSNGAKIPGLDNFSFTNDRATNLKKYWGVGRKVKKNQLQS